MDEKDMNNMEPNQEPVLNEIPGKSKGTASMVLGIISLALAWFGYSALAGVVCAIIGLVLSNKSKQLGFAGGTRTAGFVCSLIGVILNSICFVACVLCVSALGIAAASY